MGAFLRQTTVTALGVAPLPGSTMISHSNGSLGRAALKDKPDFTAALCEKVLKYILLNHDNIVAQYISGPLKNQPSRIS